MDKKEVKNRQAAIAELVSERDVQDQKELVDLLEDIYGIETNQSAISRDLRALGISKRPIGDKLVYAPKAVDVQKELLRKAVKNVVYNNSLIVVKTAAGFADMVGDFLDDSKLELLGTIAGENTVFVSPREEKNIKKIARQIRNLVGIE